MKISLVGLYSLGLAFTATSVNGQITPDASLSTKVQQQGNVTEITGGSQAGDNLFHSFQDFSVSTGGTAFFNNGADIDNILSRVTGGNISNIDGLIRANGDANLFLINPAGIVFGENARLDVGGSFLGSTGTLLFDDGTEFSGADAAVPVLTINAPIGLNLRDSTGDITNRGSLASKKDLTLSAKNLDLQGQLTAENNLTLKGFGTLKVRDSVNNPFIATAKNQLSLQASTIDIFTLNNSASGLQAGGDLILRSNNPINGDAHYYSGGNFRIEQLDGNLGDLISLNDPIVRSQGDVSFAGYTGASLHILAGGNVTIEGNLNITGVDVTANSIQETITLSDGSQVNINGNTEPTLDIRAGVNDIGTPGITGEGISPNTNATATGSNIEIGGTVTNAGGRVFLTNQYQPNRNLSGGNITVTAINTSSNVGNGGDVTIDARNNINISDGINTSGIIDRPLVTVASIEPLPVIDLTAGNGGAIALLAMENITAGNFNTSSIANLNLITEVDTIEEANGNISFPNGNIRVAGGGKINLRGNNISVGNINSSSAIAIDGESIALDNFSIIGAVLELDVADGGNINLDAEDNLTTGNINSSVTAGDRFTTSTETTPNITLAVSQLDLTIPQANLGSGGEIFLAADRVNTGSLNSAVAVTSIVDNTALAVANDPQVANAQAPSRAFSTVDVFYDDINIASGGKIIIKSDRANLGDLNSSIGITSNSMAFAQANVTNEAGVRSSANNQLSFRGIGDRPGEITLDVSDNLNVGNINAASSLNGVNNLNSQATSDGDASLATANNLDTDGSDSFNQLFFDSQTNFGLIRLNLNSPDVDLGSDYFPKIASNSYNFKTLNTCPTNSSQLSLQPKIIKTAQGKIVPATGVTIKNGQVLLTAQPNANTFTRTYSQPKSCL